MIARLACNSRVLVGRNPTVDPSSFLCLSKLGVTLRENEPMRWPCAYVALATDAVEVIDISRSELGPTVGDDPVSLH